jgi:hypothetical protein
MKKHGFLSAGAGFWYILRLAVSYYLVMSLREPAWSPSEKLLCLWFGSPALVVAAIFFIEYFRPGLYPGLASLGRLALGLGVAVSLFTAGFILVSNLLQLGKALDSGAQFMVIAFLALTVAVDLILFILTRPGQENPAEAA